MDKKIVVDEDLCIGCQACQQVAEDYFDAESGISKVIKAYDEADDEVIQKAIVGCPVDAISIKEE